MFSLNFVGILILGLIPGLDTGVIGDLDPTIQGIHSIISIRLDMFALKRRQFDAVFISLLGGE